MHFHLLVRETETHRYTGITETQRHNNQMLLGACEVVAVVEEFENIDLFEKGHYAVRISIRANNADASSTATSAAKEQPDASTLPSHAVTSAASGISPAIPRRRRPSGPAKAPQAEAHASAAIKHLRRLLATSHPLSANSMTHSASSTSATATESATAMASLPSQNPSLGLTAAAADKATAPSSVPFLSNPAIVESPRPITSSNEFRCGHFSGSGRLTSCSSALVSAETNPYFIM